MHGGGRGGGDRRDRGRPGGAARPPGNTVNGIEEGGTEEIHPALAERLGGLGAAYPHLVSADPDRPVFAGIRAAWPGRPVAGPVPEETPSDAVHRASGRLPDAGAGPLALGRLLLAGPGVVRRLRPGAPLHRVRDRCPMCVGGADGHTDHPTLDDQPSSSSSVASDGPRVDRRPRETSSAAPRTRTAFCQVSLARSGRDQPRSRSSAIRFG